MSTRATAVERRLPVGAEVSPEGIHFRVWAPAAKRVQAVLERTAGAAGGELDLDPEPSGYFSGLLAGAGEGALYRYRLDGGKDLLPDPASRFQPAGPHGPSEAIDPSRFRWTDSRWGGVRLEGQVIYELHLGTFTREGTFDAAARELPPLGETGISVLELMPVAEFPGRFGWGYDGVDLFAPTRLYGRPDDLRRLVDRAHALGMGVILDVVYNHLGPDGNYLKRFSPDYFTQGHKTDWGEAINYYGPGSGPVREFFISNAGYWIDEFHLDGLRLDATQNIYDRSSPHLLAEVSRRARQAAGKRTIILVAENEPQEAKLVEPLEKGGHGLDALWNDDFHHSARVALTGRREAYYTDYLGSPQELISAMKWGYLYQGQRYRWQKQRRGTPCFGVKPAAFVTFIENHDQVSNLGLGARIPRLTSPGRHRAMTTFLCLGPGTPMLFQGQEYGATSPFVFFADHHPELAKVVRKGRGEFLSQFPSLATPAMQAALPAPDDPASFERSKLDREERGRKGDLIALHRDLLKLRREDPAIRRAGTRGVDGAVLGPEAFLLRFFGEEWDDRLLLMNLGADLRLDPSPEPLLAPPAGKRWRRAFSSEDPRYGGSGAFAAEDEEGWRIPAHSASLFAPEEESGEGRGPS